MSSDPPGFIHL